MTSETWTYSEPGIVEIEGDFVSNSPFYAANMKVILTQGTIKYFIITNATYDVGDDKTYLTLDGQSKYTLTSDAITLHQVSTWSTPTAGFPLSDPAYSSSDHDHDSDYAASNGWTAVSDSWSYASATEITVPSGAASLYSPGMKLKITQTTVKYFWVTKVEDTKLTVYGGTDFTLANAAITSPYFSTDKAPHGFPLSPAKWTISTSDTTDREKTSPTKDAVLYSDAGSKNVVLPIGVWRVSLQCALWVNATDIAVEAKAGLSTSSSSFSDNGLVGYAYGGWHAAGNTIRVEKVVEVTSPATYYLIMAALDASMDAIGLFNSVFTMTIAAECAYL